MAIGGFWKCHRCGARMHVSALTADEHGRLCCRSERACSKRRIRNRDRRGRYDLEDMTRMCACGHTLGCHTAAAPHECLGPNPGEDHNCTCQRFRAVAMKVPAGEGKEQAVLTPAGLLALARRRG